jgi:outer membrane receptor protein involved in Fe transport
MKVSANAAGNRRIAVGPACRIGRFQFISHCRNGKPPAGNAASGGVLMKHPHPTGRRRLPVDLKMSVALAALFAGPALAQEAPADQTAQAAPIETIEVTGTRIREPNVTSPSPVMTVSSDELKLTGTINVETLLNSLPGVTPDQTSAVSNGSSGVATISLRNLGPDRTLVLIDGKRLGPGDPIVGGSYADLDFIPSTLVSSVDVLTGGASTDYGSDAVAGVVNFKLNRNFQGLQIDQTFEIAEHGQHSDQAAFNNANSPFPVAVPGDQLDGFERQSSILMGINGPDNKSNVTLYMTDSALDPVLESSRDWSACTVNGTFDANGNVIGHTCGGSSTTNYGRTLSFASGLDLAFNPAGGNTYVPFSDALRFNYGPFNYLQREDQRYTGGALAHYDVASYLDLYSDVMFADDKTVSQIAPSGLFFGNTYNINCNNPYLSAQQAGLLGCANQTAAAGSVQALIGLRFAGFDRQQYIEHFDERFVVGARGAIDPLPSWTYDASVVYWKSTVNSVYLNDLSITKINNALDAVTGPNGKPVCASGAAGCVPLNAFQLGGVTTAAFNYLTEPLLQEDSTQETVASIDFAGDFGEWGGKSPLAKNPVAAAFGYSYRYENLSINPDEAYQTGDGAGQGGPTNAVAGSYDVSEEYAELHVPLIEDFTFAEDLNFDVGIRHGDYQIYGTADSFSTNSWKLAGSWAPFKDIRFRGGFNRSERAPNASDLFTPASIGLVSGSDPCSGAMPSDSLAACELTGVKPAQYGNIPDCPAGQCSGLLGGNTALKPEVADTWTWGAVFTPTMVPGFAASVDYWTIQVDNEITSAANFAGSIVGSCATGNTLACSFIHRNPNSGIIFGNSGYIDAGEVNAGTLLTDGIDFSASYRKELADFGIENAGAVKFDFAGTLTDRYSEPFLLGANYDCVGLYGVTCSSTQSPLPAWKHRFRTTWYTPWNADFSLVWRHISGLSNENNTSQTLLAGDYTGTGLYDYADAKIPAYNYFDIAASYKYNNVTLRLGVNNILDKDPPIIDSSLGNAGVDNGNTYVGTYDTLGRVIYMTVSVKF